MKGAAGILIPCFLLYHGVASWHLPTFAICVLAALLVFAFWPVDGRSA